MAYIGNQQTQGFSSIPAKQDFTSITGTSLTLTHAVASAEGIDLFINNVRQEPTTAYSIGSDGVTVTLTGSVTATDDIYVVYNSLALQTTVPPDASVSTAKIIDGSVSTAKIIDGSVTAAKLASGVAQTPISVAVLSHVTVYNGYGGDLTAGAWRTRPFNTELDPDNIVTLSANQFTLAAGTYTIDWAANGYRCEYHVTQVYDITNSATIKLGMAMYANSAASVANTSTGSVVFTISTNTTYELQQQSSNTKTQNGMGNSTTMVGVDATHAFVKITKLA